MPLTEQSSESGTVARAYFEAVAARDLDAMVSFYKPVDSRAQGRQ